MNRLTDVFGDSAVVAEDLRKTAYELEDKHNIASYPLLEAADHIESLYAEALKMQAELAAKDDAIERFKAGLVRAGARVPIDAMTMNPNEQGLTAALVYLESELDQAAKRKYDLASIVSRGEQDDEN